MSIFRILVVYYIGKPLAKRNEKRKEKKKPISENNSRVSLKKEKFAYIL